MNEQLKQNLRDYNSTTVDLNYIVVSNTYTNRTSKVECTLQYRHTNVSKIKAARQIINAQDITPSPVNIFLKD